jgi:hypothetical protein
MMQRKCGRDGRPNSRENSATSMRFANSTFVELASVVSIMKPTNFEQCRMTEVAVMVFNWLAWAIWPSNMRDQIKIGDQVVITRHAWKRRVESPATHG